VLRKKSGEMFSTRSA